MIRLCLIVLVLGWSMVTHAEFRQWQDRMGNTLEAEYVKRIGGDLWVRDREEMLHKLNFKELSKDDLLYIQLQNPPAFRLKFRAERLHIHKPAAHHEKTVCCPDHLIVTSTNRPSHTYSIDIKRKDGKKYEHSLYLHVYWTSVKCFSPEERKRLGEWNTIVLKKYESKPFRLGSIEYGQSWTWDSKPVDFLRIARTLYTRRDDNDPQSEYEVKTNTVLESDLYFGILVVVVDERGKILAMDSDKPKLKKIHRQIMSATPGQILTGVDSHD